MTISRGDVVLVSFPFSTGAGGKVRPALVVQSDLNNRRLVNTIVAMITSTTHRAAHAPTQLLIDPTSPEGQSSGLLHPSAVTCENLFTLHQQRVLRVIGRLNSDLMAQVDERLKAAIGIK